MRKIAEATNYRGEPKLSLENRLWGLDIGVSIICLLISVVLFLLGARDLAQIILYIALAGVGLLAGAILLMVAMVCIVEAIRG